MFSLNKWQHVDVNMVVRKPHVRAAKVSPDPKDPEEVEEKVEKVRNAHPRDDAKEDRKRALRPAKVSPDLRGVEDALLRRNASVVVAKELNLADANPVAKLFDLECSKWLILCK
jgi:hypothetical protein